jgi:hypothetical protein
MRRGSPSLSLMLWRQNGALLNTFVVMALNVALYELHDGKATLS